MFLSSRGLWQRDGSLSLGCSALFHRGSLLPEVSKHGESTPHFEALYSVIPFLDVNCVKGVPSAFFP
jgi:hypothetical protein